MCNCDFPEKGSHVGQPLGGNLHFMAVVPCPQQKMLAFLGGDLLTLHERPMAEKLDTELSMQLSGLGGGVC